MLASKKLIVCTGLAVTSVALAVTGVSVAAAAPGAKTHTLTLDSVQTSQKQLNGSAFADADTDKQNGKVIGYDVVNGAYHAKTQSITFDVAFSLKGGIINIHGSGTVEPNALTGTITGGTGMFKGVKGTVSGSAYGNHDDDEHVTISYH